MNTYILSEKMRTPEMVGSRYAKIAFRSLLGGNTTLFGAH